MIVVPSQGRCDFCSGFTGQKWWEYPASPFKLDVGDQEYASDGGWAACRPCRDLVETGQWSDLAQRLPAPPGLPAAIAVEHVAAVERIHAAFRASRLGPGVQHMAQDE